MLGAVGNLHLSTIYDRYRSITVLLRCVRTFDFAFVIAFTFIQQQDVVEIVIEKNMYDLPNAQYGPTLRLVALSVQYIQPYRTYIIEVDQSAFFSYLLFPFLETKRVLPFGLCFVNSNVNFDYSNICKMNTWFSIRRLMLPVFTRHAWRNYCSDHLHTSPRILQPLYSKKGILSTERLLVLACAVPLLSINSHEAASYWYQS